MMYTRELGDEQSGANFLRANFNLTHTIGSTSEDVTG
jgi:hypothetical protein